MLTLRTRARGARWTFLLATTAALAACGDSTSPPKPVSIAYIGGALTAAAGQEVSPGPRIEIHDAKGNAIAGVPFTVTVGGGGTLTGTPAATATGSTAVGDWTLGTVAGAQSLTVQSGALAPLTINATATAGAPASASSGGAPQTGNGIVVSLAVLTPSIKVVDAFGNAVPGVQITTQITGGGTLQVPNPVTNAAGVGSAGAWTLGPAFGPQTVSLTAPGLTPVVYTVTAAGAFTVDVRFAGTPPSAQIQAAFAAAALRVSQVVTTALTPINAAGISAATFCGDATLPVLNETIPNLVIYAEIGPIDGVGGILGQSGPCGLRTSTSLPFLGIMKFDEADMATMVANGTINAVILHEMQHVLGFGTLWSGLPYFPVTLLQSPGTSNPIYLGAAARAQYVAAGGTSPSGVPVEGGTKVGTSNSHWRESVFDTELMTGFLNGFSQPFSKTSIGALADLGYAVSYAASDQFVVPAPGALRLAPTIDADTTHEERLIFPRFKVDDRGHITTLPPRDSTAVPMPVTPQSVRKPGG